MKTNKIKTLFIIVCSSAYTGYVAILAILRSTFSHIDRPWVDKTIQTWTRNLLKMVEVDYKIYNPHHVTPPKNRATLIVCNHTSLFDIPLSFAAFPHHSMRMLAKKELLRVPFFGRGLSVSEFPSIDRHNRQQAIQDLKKIRTLMESGILIWVAPEGTRSKNGKLGPFKKGAFITAIEAQAIIIPIGIKGASDILPPKSLNLNLNQRAEVHIGQPIDSTRYTLENKDELIHEVRESMLALLGE
jgi:1-acyl-sn-glycerol-3-phosphate acyltransferase